MATLAQAPCEQRLRPGHADGATGNARVCGGRGEARLGGGEGERREEAMLLGEVRDKGRRRGRRQRQN